MKDIKDPYWGKRQTETFTEGESDILELAKKLKLNYEQAINTITKEINAFYGRFAKEQGISLKEAKQLLSRTELKAFNQELKDYIDYAKDNDFSENHIKELTLQKYRTKVSRLEELKTNIQFQLAKALQKSQKQIHQEMLNMYEDAFYKTTFNLDKGIGMSVSFTKPNVGAIEKYLSQTINLGNYSIHKNGIWTTKIPKLMNILSVKIPQGIILGQNPKKVAKSVTDPIEKDYNDIVRLVRTEYNFIFNTAANDSYKACGIGQYQILATLDERTCDSCGPLDLTVVSLDEREVGINCPPFHPNCRCTTIPFFEPDEFDVKSERIAKDKNGKPYMVPADLTYKEWQQGLTEHKGGVEYWKPKGA